MRECDNSKIHISSNFIVSICLLIMFITLEHLATLNHTTPNYTSLHLSTLHFISFTLHYYLIWLNPSTFPIVLFDLTSLNQTQYGSHIPKLISKVMNPFTALKNFSETFPILRRVQTDIINIHRSHAKCPLFLSDFNET